MLTRLFQENWTAGIDRHATANNAHADLGILERGPRGEGGRGGQGGSGFMKDTVEYK